MTNARFRKFIAFARTLLFVLCVICVGLTIASVDSESFAFPLICFGIAVICYVIAYALDELLWQTND